MKKVCLSTILTIAIALNVFATNENNAASIIRKVNDQFTNVSNIEVSAKKDFTKASFIQDAKRVEAFYDKQGQFIGKAQVIQISDLPTSAKRAFAKRFEGYSVIESISFEGVEESAYFISAKKDDQSVILKVSDVGLLSVCSRN